MTSSSQAKNIKSGRTSPKLMVDVRPNLIPQWHTTKNSAIDISSVMTNMKEEVWRVCELGHEWQATPQYRSNVIAGCPLGLLLVGSLSC